MKIYLLFHLNQAIPLEITLRSQLEFKFDSEAIAKLTHMNLKEPIKNTFCELKKVEEDLFKSIKLFSEFESHIHRIMDYKEKNIKSPAISCDISTIKKPLTEDELNLAFVLINNMNNIKDPHPTDTQEFKIVKKELEDYLKLKNELMTNKYFIEKYNKLFDNIFLTENIKELRQKALEINISLINLNTRLSSFTQYSPIISEFKLTVEQFHSLIDNIYNKNKRKDVFLPELIKFVFSSKETKDKNLGLEFEFSYNLEIKFQYNIKSIINNYKRAIDVMSMYMQHFNIIVADYNLKHKKQFNIREEIKDTKYLINKNTLDYNLLDSYINLKKISELFQIFPDFPNEDVDAFIASVPIDVEHSLETLGKRKGLNIENLCIKKPRLNSDSLYPNSPRSGISSDSGYRTHGTSSSDQEIFNLFEN